MREQSLNGKNNDKNISCSPLATKKDRIHEQRKQKIHFKEWRDQETPPQSIQKYDIGNKEKNAFCPRIEQEYSKKATRKCVTYVVFYG